MRKKLVLFFMAVAFAATTCAASNIEIGGSLNDFGSDTTENGFYIGLQKTQTLNKGVIVGLGFNVNTFQVQRKEVSSTLIVTTSGAAYTMAADLLLGYSLEEGLKIPLIVTAGVGYGVTRDNIVNENSWNPIYSASASLTIYKSLGIGVRYSTTTTELLGVDDVEIQSYAVYLNIRY